MAPRTVILDTSVLLADREAFRAYRDDRIVIPLAVVKALDRMTSDLTLGSSAVAAIDWIDSLGDGRPIIDIPTKDGGLVTVEKNNASRRGLPNSLQDNAILAVAHNYANRDAAAIFISNDAATRTLARSVGIRVSRHISHNPSVPLTIPAQETYLTKTQVDEFHRTGEVSAPSDVLHLPFNATVELRSAADPQATAGIALIRPSSSHSGTSLVRIPLNRRVWDVSPRNLEQKVAMHLLSPDSGCDIVGLSGTAGTGKSLIAYATGLHGCQESDQYKSMLVVRSIYAVGGQRQGFLPGTEQEKMAPWMQAIKDTLEVCAEKATIEHAIDSGLIECVAPTFMRGRTLNSRFLVIDEAQNLDYDVLRTLLSRSGTGTKVVLCFDTSQCDNIAVNPADGILKVVDRLTGDPRFGMVHMTDVQRGPVAQIVADRL